MMTLEELDKQSREAVIAFLERKVDKLELRRITSDNYSLEWKDKVDGDVFNLECFYYRVKKQYRVSLFSDGKTVSVDNEHRDRENMTKHEIEIPDLPEGWMPVSYRVPRYGENYLGKYGIETARHGDFSDQYLIVEKIPPRRIVLEETNEVRRPRYGEYFREGLVDSKVELCTSHNYEYAVRIWRVVEEGE